MPEEMTFVLISAEERAAQYPDTFEIGTRSQREQLKVGMLAKLIFAQPWESDATRQYTERAWVKITSVATAEVNGQKAVTYVGVTVDEILGDIEVGTKVLFGPEHVCEWDVPPQLGRTRRKK